MYLPMDPLRILLVDDSTSLRMQMAFVLTQQGHTVLEAADGPTAIDLFMRERPDLVLLDVEMPGQDGYSVARRVRQMESGVWTPIVFLSAHDRESDLWDGIESGGDDYLTKPVSPVVLAAKLRAMHRLRLMELRNREISEELRRVNLQLRNLSVTDELTGLLNRRAFDDHLQREIRSAQREGSNLTLIICDVDYFKRYNDTLGHQAGDACLKQVGAILKSACLRPRDLACRYGGEEFALILPSTPKSGALTYSRGLQAVLARTQLSHPESDLDGGRVTLSGGITTCIPDDKTTAEGMVMRADKALYTAKTLGRNRFFSFEMQTDNT